jgi:hypothetical protein
VFKIAGTEFHACSAFGRSPVHISVPTLAVLIDHSWCFSLHAAKRQEKTKNYTTVASFQIPSTSLFTNNLIRQCHMVIKVGCLLWVRSVNIYQGFGLSRWLIIIIIIIIILNPLAVCVV